jgi:hypothetical protein
MSAGITPRKTVAKAIQVSSQLRLQTTNLVGIHASTSLPLETTKRDDRFADLAKLSNINLAL